MLGACMLRLQKLLLKTARSMTQLMSERNYLYNGRQLSLALDWVDFETGGWWKDKN